MKTNCPTCGVEHNHYSDFDGDDHDCEACFAEKQETAKWAAIDAHCDKNPLW